MGLIYRIENNINGKIYVGKTQQDLKARMRRHRAEVTRGTNRPLYNSLRKHGFEAFTIVVIEEVDDADLIDRERFWIQHYSCIHPKGYNFTSGGEGGDVKRHWSKEDKDVLHKRQADKRRGQKRTPSQRQNFSRAAKLRWSQKTEEEKRDLSAKISNTLKSIGRRPPITKLYGASHPNWVEVDIETVLVMIQLRFRMKDIAKQFSTSNQVIWYHLKPTGKTYKQWREHYNVDRGYRRLGPDEYFERSEVREANSSHAGW